MVTNAKIAKAAGVSPAIVSRIVNRDPTLRVSDATRLRVQELVDKWDYSPNVAARALKATQIGVIALVVHDLTSSVYAEIINGAHRAATKFGKTILVGEASTSHEKKSHLEAIISGRGVDGLILQGAETESDRTLERAAVSKVPFVLLQAGNPKKHPVVRLDDEAAGRYATRHLLDLGHRRIGFIGVSRKLAFSADRLFGWQKELDADGVTVDPNWSEQGGNNFEGGAEAVKQLLNRSPELTCVVVANVVSAIGVLAALHDLGRKVPEQISVIAVHDIPLTEFLRPSLTVVKMPLDLLGEVAVNMLCNVAPGQSIQPGLNFVTDRDPVIVARQSTCAPAISS